MSIIITTMAAAIGTHTHVCSSSVIRKHNIYTHSTCFSQWSCLRQLSPSISQHSSYYLNLEKRRKIKRRGVYASLFGVGAPEALVIGVVALLVFGPKGLAEAARSLGSTLRAFQPTIRELQDVSREFKSTLEREIGLDEIQNPVQSNTTSSTNKANSSPSKSITPEDSQMKVDLMADGSPSTNNAYSSEDLLKITEEQLKAAAAEQEKQIPTLAENRSEPQSQTQDIVQEIEAAGPPLPPQNPET